MKCQVFTGLLILLATCDQAKPLEQAQRPAPAETQQKQTVERSLTVLDGEGLAALRKETAAAGQVLVMDVWATWCGPCIELFAPLHAALHERTDVRLVTLTLDDADYEADAIQFLETHHALTDAWRFPDGGDAQLALANQIKTDWKTLSVPAIFIHNRDGTLVAHLDDMRGSVSDKVEAILEAIDQAH